MVFPGGLDQVLATSIVFAVCACVFFFTIAVNTMGNYCYPLIMIFRWRRFVDVTDVSIMTVGAVTPSFLRLRNIERAVSNDQCMFMLFLTYKYLKNNYFICSKWQETVYLCFLVSMSVCICFSHAIRLLLSMQCLFSLKPLLHWSVTRGPRNISTKYKTTFLYVVVYELLDLFESFYIRVSTITAI